MSRIFLNCRRKQKSDDGSQKNRSQKNDFLSSVFCRLSSGFTLIEVLVSVSLVSVIMLMIWQTTAQTINARQRIDKRNEVYHNARVSAEKMVQDISMAFLLANTPAEQGQRQGSPQIKTAFKGDSETLQFSSLAHLRLFKNARESDSCNIGYKLESDPDNRDLLILMRRESKWLTDKPDEGGIWIPLAEKVKKIKFEYYDGRKYEWQSSWNTESDTMSRLPRAVKVTFDFENPDNKDEDISLATVAWIGMYSNAIDF
ncbi:MAG: prepilin-type N-terminal cleavage/methylation domain-containing protein [Deltaproteobacteria bacterium]|nr:prepilin-type N-terminal cleavage/methylation domain-containing protein [Deltaproteobacteria bacterium]